MSWESLKAAVEAVITDNANNEITGQVLRELMTNNVIPQLGANLFKGRALPATTPGTPEKEEFYFATKGSYPNFSAIEVAKNEFALLKYNGSAWVKTMLFDFDQVNLYTENKWLDLSSTMLSSDLSEVRLSIFKSIKDIWFSENIENLADLKISLITFSKDYTGTANDYKIELKLSQSGAVVSTFTWANILTEDIDKDIHLTKTQTVSGEEITCNIIVNFSKAIAAGDGTMWNSADLDSLKIRAKSSQINETIADSASKSQFNYNLAQLINKYFIADFNALNAASQSVRDNFKAIGDVWAEGLIGSAYENYQFSIYYAAKDDPTFSDIFWLGSRPTSGDAWTGTLISSETDTYWDETKSLNHKTFVWNGITFNFLIFPELLPTAYVGLTGIVLNIDDLPKTELGKSFLYARDESITQLETDVALLNTKIENIEGGGTISLNQLYDYLTANPYKSSYFSGHDVLTDIKKNVAPPAPANISSNTTGVMIFSEEGAKYLQGAFKENVRDKLKLYETEDGSPIYPVYFKSKVYNAHASESASVKLGIRLKIDGVWYLPGTIVSIAAGETKTLECLINPDGAFNWSQLGTDVFDLWIYIATAALEADPVWLYFGDADLYYYDEKQREIRQTISPEIIKPGIQIEQLSESLQAKIEGGASVSAKSKKSIVLAGSSITWGEGYLDDRFAGEVDEFIKNELSTTILADSVSLSYSQTPSSFTSKGLYKSTGRKLSALNDKITVKIDGDELAICQAIQRTADYGLMRVKADGVTIGEFTNHNDTLGSDTDSFVGDGSAVKFLMKHPYTYNHVVTVGGVAQTVVMNTGGYGGTIPGGADAMIIRAFDTDGSVKHMIWFAVAPGNGVAIEMAYDYGKVLYHELSTVGQLDGDDENNESPYGFGSISFDPASPSATSSGMEFRSIDKRAFWIHKFASKAEREIEIEIIGGTNPYFILNFVSNRFHNFMNAGIGGWQLSLLIDNNKINDYGNFFKSFLPDLIVNESATNDDWGFGARRLSRTVTGLSEAQVKELWTLELSRIEYQAGTTDYEVDFTTGLIASIDEFSLVSPQIVGSGVAQGDLVRIGNYYGDNKQVAVRLVDSVNTGTGEITWLQPLNAEEILNISSLTDLVGKEVSIRDLSTYKSRYVDLITKLQKIVPQAKILIAQPGLSNYFLRQLWGYDIIHRQLANEYHSVDTIEVTDWLYDFQQGIVDGSNNETIVADGSTEYSLAQTNHWQGFEVWVDGKNVYGKDCYIKSGWGYGVDPALSGAAISVTANYDKSYTRQETMKLVFFQNAPASGNIIVKKASTVWSSDFCHTGTTGGYVYGQVYNQKIKENL